MTGIRAQGDRFQQWLGCPTGLARRVRCVGRRASKLAQTGLQRALKVCDGHPGTGAIASNSVWDAPNWACASCTLCGLTGLKVNVFRL